jgi:plastocyanin
VTEPATDADRLAAVERQLDQLLNRRDSWVAFSFWLSALAVLTAAFAVFFGIRAIDESKDNVAAGGAPTSAAAPEQPEQPCKQAAGFPDSAQVQDKGTEPASGATVSVEAGDFFFGPTCVSGVAAGTVTLTVENTGQALHNVSIADQGIDEDVEAGQTITVQVEVSSSPLQYVCKYHRTSGMVGALLPVGP